MSPQSHYPDFDVMREAPEWDDHTREIVEKRLETSDLFEVLSGDETQLLLAICATLVDDDREEILDYILNHINQNLKSEIGESQRKNGIPPEKILLRKGLSALAVTARSSHGRSFLQLSLIERQTLLGQVERGELPATGAWTGVPQKELFKKILNLTVEAYYSHPAIWSEIGYAGPAYPRGYVRTELGLADPWEPIRGSSSVSQKE